MGMYGEQDVHGRPTCRTYMADQRVDVHGRCGTYTADRRTRQTDMRGTSADDLRSEGAGTGGKGCRSAMVSMSFSRASIWEVTP